MRRREDRANKNSIPRTMPGHTWRGFRAAVVAIESMVPFLRHTLQRFGRFIQVGRQFLGHQVALFRFRLLALHFLDHSEPIPRDPDRKSTRLNSSHLGISYAVFCL